MQDFQFEIIGTHLHLVIDTPHACGELFRVIEMRLSAFEKKFSRFIEGNWLHELNKNREANLDEDGKTMLMTALEVAKSTDGYFDPTVGKRLTELGYGNTTLLANTKGKGYGDYRDIEFDGESVKLHGDVTLEFGGVGKGYLLDVIRGLVTHFFSEQSLPLPRYIIDFGGDIYAYGKDWKIGLENPHNIEEVIGTIDLDDGFLACSSGSKRKWGAHHHLIDPKTGESASEVIATFIEGPTGILVDSYATALCVMPFMSACELLYHHEMLEGVIMSSDGRFFRSLGSRSEIFSS